MKYNFLRHTASFTNPMVGLFAIFSLFFTSCYEDVEPEILDDHFFSAEVDIRYRYDAIKESQKTVVYSENFSAGLGNWPSVNANGLTTGLRQGKYVLNNTRDDLIRWINEDIDFNKYPNFELESNIRIISSASSGGGIGLSSDNGNLVGLTLNTESEVSCFSIDKATNKTTKYKDRETLNGLNPTGASLPLTIRRIQGNYYFFVDKKSLRLEVSANLFTPQNMSLIMSGATEIEISNIVLRSIAL